MLLLLFIIYTLFHYIIQLDYYCQYLITHYSRTNTHISVKQSNLTIVISVYLHSYTPLTRLIQYISNTRNTCISVAVLMLRMSLTGSLTCRFFSVLLNQYNG